MESVAELLQAGLALQQQKKFKEAESVYRRVLEGDPNQSDALHLLGLVRSSLGNPAEAIEWIEKAIRVAPNSPVFYSNLGVMLRQAGKIPEAIEAYLAAINLAPEVADTYFNLGKAYKMQGDLVRSEEALLRSIALNPRYLSPWLSLIGLEVERHRYAEGIEKGKQALQLLPNNIELLMSVGAVFKRNQQNEEALELYRRALAISPDHVDLLCRIGSTLITQQRIEEGKTYIERAARHDPTSMHVLNAYGLLHNTLGDSVAGAKYLRDSIQRYPHHAPSYCNLSNALRKLGNLTEALEVARKGVELDANNVESRVIEAGSLLALGELEEANATLRKAIQLKGGYKDAHDTLLMCMHYQPTTTVASLLAEHLDWDSKYSRPLQQPCSFDKGRSNRAKIRIGFTSGDLGAHPVGYFVVRLLESIDRSCFETYVYSDRVGEDWLSKRISQSVDAWKTTCGISDADLTTMIRGDKVDVLFDLSGHTAQNRLLVFARRAAPVQISWAGYVGTTGLQAMDYLLADPFHVPREMEPFLAEKVLRMPNGYVTFLPPEDAPDVGPPADASQSVCNDGSHVQSGQSQRFRFGCVGTYSDGRSEFKNTSGLWWLDRSNESRTREKAVEVLGA